MLTLNRLLPFSLLFAAVLVLHSGCGSEHSSAPPEEVVLRGDTAEVAVLGRADIQSHKIQDVRWEEAADSVKQWLRGNGFEHLRTTYDTERMQAIGYERFVSEDRTGVRIYGLSLWTRGASDP